jgi:hypothetical protein
VVPGCPDGPVEPLSHHDCWTCLPSATCDCVPGAHGDTAGDLAAALLETELLALVPLPLLLPPAGYLIGQLHFVLAALLLSDDEQLFDVAFLGRQLHVALVLL